MNYRQVSVQRLSHGVSAGFTLIEMMIVVVIISILASIALPAYQDYVRRGQLQEAFTFLADYRVKMEQYFQDNKNYGDTAGTACATAASAGTWSGFAPTGAKYFTFGCVTADSGQSFVITATGNAGLTTGYDYSIDQSGNKVTVKYAGAVKNANCWMTHPYC